MSDSFFREAFNKYGLRAIAGVVVASVVIWGIGHWTAKPGTQISILWGLLEYTKQDEKPEVFPSLNGSEETAPKDLQPSHEIIQVSDETRAFINERPIDIVSKIQDKTDLQGQILFENLYKGKWMRIRGPILNIIGNKNSASLVFSIDGVVVRVNMNNSDIAKIEHLSEGDSIEVEGQFDRIDEFGPDLVKGKILTIE